ncbi:MAG: DedA family protein [Actinobacteria bacterium]|nr:DedA family protein [Actinomycetota bacterium]
MEAKIAEFVVRYFNLYGYYLVFFFLMAENTFMLGLLIPGETVLLLSGFLASAGELDLTTVIIVGIAAAILGNNIGYFLGREGGRRLMERLGSRWLSPGRIKAAEDYFDKHGQKTVFIGRFVAGVRTFVPVLAGASKMSYPKFLAYTVTAVVIWTVGVTLLGFFFGEERALLLSIIKRTELVILVAVVLVAVYLYIKHRRRRREREGKSGSGGS